MDNKSHFAQLHNQALGLPMQRLLQIYSRSPPEEVMSPGPQNIEIFYFYLAGKFLCGIKRQIQDSMTEWANQLLNIMMVKPPQFFEGSLQECRWKKELKSTAWLLQEQKHNLKSSSKHISS